MPKLRCGWSPVPYGSYSRGSVTFRDGRTIDSIVSVNRYKCDSCGVTHALLPDVLIPYTPYTLRFKLTVLLAYFERSTTVVKICENFGIAVSTLYEWKKLFLSHKQLLLGVVVDMKTPSLNFLLNLLGNSSLSTILRDFFQQFACSLLSKKPGKALSVATSSVPP